VSVRVEIDLNGARVPVVLDDQALAAIAAALDPPAAEPASPYVTIPEAAELQRCKRQRVDDLLSQCRLTRHKDGSRTLIARAELDAYIARAAA
jgi:excisionase family DNA binding protein